MKATKKELRKIIREEIQLLKEGEIVTMKKSELRKIIKEEMLKLNEWSTTEFIADRGKELKTAVKTIKDLEKYTSNVDKNHGGTFNFETTFATKIIPNLKSYDNKLLDDVLQYLFNTNWLKRLSVNSLASMAIDNFRKHGTEPDTIIDLIDDLDFYTRKFVK